MSSPNQESNQPRILRPRLQSHSLTSSERVTILQRILNGYEFKDDLLALEALQDTTLPQEIHGRMRGIPYNRDIAILGDILLNLHLCLQWNKTGDSRDTFEKIKQSLVSNAHLEKVGREIGLDECIIRQGSPTQLAGRLTMASTVEAIVGAVWKDAEKHRPGTGFDAAFKVAAELGLNYNK